MYAGARPCKMVTSRRVQCQEISYVCWCKAMQGGNE